MINRVLSALAVTVLPRLPGGKTMEGFGKQLFTRGDRIEKKPDQRK